MDRLVPMFLLLFVGTSLLLGAVSLPLMLGRIKPNMVYGVRTPQTLRDEAAWYRGNAYGGRVLLIAAGVQLIAVIVLALLPPLRNNMAGYCGDCGTVIVGSVLAASVIILRYVRTL